MMKQNEQKNEVSTMLQNDLMWDLNVDGALK